MVENIEAVPPFPKKRKERRAYFEQNKEAIIADYYSMKLLDFFKRWRITTGRWLKLKIQWGVEKKGQEAPQTGGETSNQASVNKPLWILRR